MNRAAMSGRRRAIAALSLAVISPLAAAQALTISAAASLADAFREIGARFEATRPGTTLRFNFAASGLLVQQIVHGAPADVFASADAESMDRGVQQKVIDAATRIDFAANTLVVVLPASAAPAINTLSGLTGAAVKRIAIGKPASVPAGRYALQALTAAGLWPALEARTVYADNVRQVLDYVVRGEVEAGFVYRTDALLAKDKVRVAFTVTGHAPVAYPVAVVADSRQGALAREFVAFLAAPEAQATLARFGFSKPR
jgi:molybdate transport system substrate-binding protein